MLEVNNLNVFYGRIQAIWDISLKVNFNEIVAIIGANGAGKTTLLRAILGLSPVHSGSVIFTGQEITNKLAEKKVAMGLCMIPEGREIFSNLSVLQNLKMGAFHRLRQTSTKEIDEEMNKIFQMFPILKNRLNQTAGTLSGGEQQMLAIGRALMSRPKMILMDEPTLGLSPLMVSLILETIVVLKEQGIGLLVVEQNARKILQIAHRGYVIQGGRIIAHDRGEELLRDPEIVSMYLLGTSRENSIKKEEDLKTIYFAYLTVG